jgi:hypothetical protein
MTDKLSEREEKGLQELCLKHGLTWPLYAGTRPFPCLPTAIAFGRELLRMVKEEACKAICPHCRGSEDAKQPVEWMAAKYVCNFGNIPDGYVHRGNWIEVIPCEASAIRAADFGPMFDKLGRTQP